MASAWQGDLFKPGPGSSAQGRLAFRPVNRARRRNEEARSIAAWLLPIAALAIVVALGFVSLRLRHTDIGYRLATLREVILHLENERRDLARLIAEAEATKPLEQAARDLGMVPPTLTGEAPLR